MKQINYTDLTSNELKTLISKNESFVLLGIRGNITDSIKQVETAIESQGLKCRVSTDFKASIVGAGALGAIGAVLAAPTTALLVTGLAAHTAFTFNPDYTITKDYINAKLTIEYKKKKK